MKKIIEKINIKNINNSIYFLQKILKIFYILLILLITYFIILICKEWKIYKIFIELLGILFPLFLGIIISYILNPIIKKLSTKIDRKLSTTIIYIIILLIICFMCCYIYPKFINEINELIKSLPLIIKNSNKFINNITHNNFDIDINKIINKYSKDIIFLNLITTLKNIIQIFGIIILGLMISFYLSINFDDGIKKIFNLLPVKNKKRLKKLLLEIDDKVFSYIKGTSIISLIIFVVSSISFEIIGLKGSIFFGLYNAITNIIPYVGPYIGAIPIIIVAFTQSKKIGFIVLIVIIIIQALESYILHPYIMSKSMQLHPVTILMSLLIFGYFFGILGMIVAMPIVSSIKTIYKFYMKK